MYLGTYCMIDAHAKCPLGRARCRCECHHPPPIVTTTSRKGTRPSAKAIVVTDSEGRRVCPVCRTTVLVKKNPHGPGRYPSACEACR